MNKIKTLLFLTSTLALIYLIHFFIDAFVFSDTTKHLWNEEILSKFEFIFNYTIEIGILFVLIVSSIGLYKIVKSNLFNPLSYKYFNLTGLVLIVVSSFDLIFTIIKIISLASPELWVERLFINFLLFILGLISHLFSDVLKNSFRLKKENDLTI